MKYAIACSLGDSEGACDLPDESDSDNGSAQALGEPHPIPPCEEEPVMPASRATSREHAQNPFDDSGGFMWEPEGEGGGV